MAEAPIIDMFTLLVERQEWGALMAVEAILLDFEERIAALETPPEP